MSQPKPLTREWGEGPEGDADVLAYINATPLLLSLLYDLDLLPEQHPDHESPAWEKIFTITNHWREAHLRDEPSARNQCDGCARGLGMRNGLHIDKDGMAVMGCTANRYAQQPSARLNGTELDRRIYICRKTADEWRHSGDALGADYRSEEAAQWDEMGDFLEQLRPSIRKARKRLDEGST